MAIRVGVVGVGHLGRHHVRLLAGIEEAELTCVAELNEELQARVSELEEAREDTAKRSELVRASERSWRIRCRSRNVIVMGDDTGEIAEIPIDLARIIARGNSLDAVVVKDGDFVLFQRGEEVLAEIPASLWVVLDKVLERFPWDSPGN